MRGPAHFGEGMRKKTAHSGSGFDTVLLKRPGIVMGWQETSFASPKKPRALLPPMPQSLSFLLVHLIFSTKDRTSGLDSGVRSALHAYLATVVRL